MATYQQSMSVTRVCNAVVRVGRFVVHNAANDQYNEVAAAQARADGICLETQPTVGADFPMGIPNGGIYKVVAGAPVNSGDRVASDATGGAIPVVVLAGNWWMGVALEAAAAAGDIFEMQFFGPKELF